MLTNSNRERQEITGKHYDTRDMCVTSLTTRNAFKKNFKLVIYYFPKSLNTLFLNLLPAKVFGHYNFDLSICIN